MQWPSGGLDGWNRMQGLCGIGGFNDQFFISRNQFEQNTYAGNSGLNLSVTATMEERKKADPNLHVFTLDSEGYIWNGTSALQSASDRFDPW
jgi:hypothetical protein